MGIKQKVASKILEVSRSAISKIKKVGRVAKVTATAAAAEESVRLHKELSDLLSAFQERVTSVVTSTTEVVRKGGTAIVDDQKEKALAAIRSRTDASFGRIKLIAQESLNTSSDPASSKYFGAAQERIQSIVTSSAAKLGPEQSAAIESYARSVLNRVQQAAEGSFAGELDPTGLVDSALEKHAESASQKVLKASAEAIAAIAEREARAVNVENVTPDPGDIPEALRKKSTASLRKMLRSAEKGTQRSTWTVSQLKAALQSR